LSCVRQVQQMGIHGDHAVNRGGADSKPFSDGMVGSKILIFFAPLA
jgi:hypothetical protein